MAKLKKVENSWQAEYDADTMARYEEIMADARRRSAAIKVAKKKAKDLESSADNMRKVASRKK